MTAKEYLLDIRKTSKKILAVTYDIAEIQEQKDGLKSIELSERVKVSGTYTNQLDDLIKREDTLLAERKHITDEWWHCRQIIKSIKKQNYADVLRYYYLQNNDWQKVADKMHTVKRNVYFLHGKALQEFRKITGMD